MVRACLKFSSLQAAVLAGALLFSFGLVLNLLLSLQANSTVLTSFITLPSLTSSLHFTFCSLAFSPPWHYPLWSSSFDLIHFLSSLVSSNLLTSYFTLLNSLTSSLTSSTPLHLPINWQEGKDEIMS